MTMNPDLTLFTHTYRDNKAHKTIIALHGTGGDEDSFMFLDQTLEQRYNMIGIRGNVNEAGMNRYFRRYAPGEFDEENIRHEAAKLHKFITALTRADNTNVEDYIYLGYSNGANMILAMLILYPSVIRQCVLMHPMLPIKPSGSLDLRNRRAFVSYGVHDPMVEEAASHEVIELLESAGVAVTVDAYDWGHGISEDEMQKVITYITSL